MKLRTSNKPFYLVSYSTTGKNPKYYTRSIRLAKRKYGIWSRRGKSPYIARIKGNSFSYVKQSMFKN